MVDAVERSALVKHKCILCREKNPIQMEITYVYRLEFV